MQYIATSLYLSGHTLSQFVVHLYAFVCKLHLNLCNCLFVCLFVCTYSIYPKNTFLVSGPNFCTDSVGREDIRLMVTRMSFEKEKERGSTKNRGFKSINKYKMQGFICRGKLEEN